MIFNLLLHVPSNTCYIRPADEGLPDTEFDVGVRVTAQDSSVAFLILEAMIAKSHMLLVKEEWTDLVNCDDDGCRNHVMRSKYAGPKSCTETYDRGPYSKYTRGD